MKFADLPLHSNIQKAIEETAYKEPTQIQQKAIPIVLSGRDILAAAQTGTGKTAAFTLPILHLLNKKKNLASNQVRSLIITPTRELAAQISDNIKVYNKHLSLKSDVVFGGVKINPQMMRLRKGTDILVATPGRLIDLFQQNAIKFDQFEILVLDEADRMLDMGFIHDIKRIMKFLPAKKQTLLFSATFTDEIRKLAKKIINNPVEVSVTPKNSTVKKVQQWLVPVDKKRKSSLLIKLIQEQSWTQVLVFCRTKHGANRLVKKLLEAKISAVAIHGNKSQSARTKALANFKNGKSRALIATDIAARGIDIHELPIVVNFDLPNVPEDYVHRIGRTGRAGKSGEAISLVSADEIRQLTEIERLIQKLITREYISGYEPKHEVPESKLQPTKKKKPKKNRSKESTKSSKQKDLFQRKKRTQGSRNQNRKNSPTRKKPTKANKDKKTKH